MNVPRRALLRPDTAAMTTVLSLLTAIGPLSTDCYLPALPAITAAFGSTIAQTQLTLSFFLAGFAVGQFVYGSLSDRWGRKPVLAAGLVVFCGATLACSFAPSVEALIACRFVQAVGGSGPIVLARAMVRDLYEGRRAAQELARMGTIMGVVPAVAPVLGGLLQVWSGWRASFLLCLVFGLALLAVVLLFLPESLLSRTTDRFSPGAIVREFRELLRVPSYRVNVALAVLTYSGLFSWISASSFVLQEVYGLSTVQFAVSFAVIVAGFMIGSWVAQRIVTRLGPQRVCQIGSVCLALAGLAMLACVGLGIGSFYGILVPMALYTFGVGATMPNAMALAMAPFPTRAGAASSLLGLCQMSGAAMVGAGLGRALGASALPMALTIAALGVAAALLLLATARFVRSA